MLVLSRKIEESIVIANAITITVLAVRGGKVRLGIVAPEGVPLDRQEKHVLKMAQCTGGNHDGGHHRICGG
jgi:carbon storage regulator